LASAFNNFLDNRASFISTPYRHKLANVKAIDPSAITGLGMILTAHESGTLHIQFNGSGPITELLHLPDSRIRLFSETQLARHGIEIQNDYSGLQTSKIRVPRNGGGDGETEDHWLWHNASASVVSARIDSISGARIATWALPISPRKGNRLRVDHNVSAIVFLSFDAIG
jgi:hypothetical protein